MKKFDKALDFYLRGFNSEYIRRRTGLSKQLLLRQLKMNKTMYTKKDIHDYQINYIRNHYTKDQIVNAYSDLIEKYKEPYKLAKSHNLICLGCAFGDYKRVFQILIKEI